MSIALLLAGEFSYCTCTLHCLCAYARPLLYDYPVQPYAIALAAMSSLQLCWTAGQYCYSYPLQLTMPLHVGVC